MNKAKRPLFERMCIITQISHNLHWICKKYIWSLFQLLCMEMLCMQCFTCILCDQIKKREQKRNNKYVTFLFLFFFHFLVALFLRGSSTLSCMKLFPCHREWQKCFSIQHKTMLLCTSRQQIFCFLSNKLWGMLFLFYSILRFLWFFSLFVEQAAYTRTICMHSLLSLCLHTHAHTPKYNWMTWKVFMLDTVCGVCMFYLNRSFRLCCSQHLIKPVSSKANELLHRGINLKRINF